MKNYNYLSLFKDDIKDFLKYKESKGQKLHPIACYLYQFDNYCLKLNANKLTRELVEKWLELKENECPNTRRLRAWSIKSFAKYLNLMEKDSFVIDSKIYNCKSTYIPHIFTDIEIKAIFKYINLIIKNTSCFPNNTEQVKLFYEILYCCGLRDSELINLKYEDIDLKNKTILIKHSKCNISRLIYFDNELYSDLKHYINNRIEKSNEYLFYNSKTKAKRSLNSLYESFQLIIKKEEFDKNIHYRLHDFRHTFAVKNIKRIYEKGEDVYSFLPILMVYMGHSNIRSTEYYLRFTPDVYEKVTKQVESYFGNIIPKIDEGDFYE